jgi:hypothetical protein
MSQQPHHCLLIDGVHSKKVRGETVPQIVKMEVPEAGILHRGLKGGPPA